MNKIVGTNMKDEKLEIFFLSNKDELEELIAGYSRFKDRYNERKILEIRGKLDKRQINGIDKEWTYQKYMLVHDFRFGSNQIAIETSINIKNFKITIFGRNKEGKNFLKSDDFFNLTGLNKNLKSKENRKLEVVKLKNEDSIDTIVSELQNLLSKMSEGFDKYKDYR